MGAYATFFATESGRVGDEFSLYVGAFLLRTGMLKNIKRKYRGEVERSKRIFFGMIRDKY